MAERKAGAILPLKKRLVRFLGKNRKSLNLRILAKGLNLKVMFQQDGHCCAQSHQKKVYMERNIQTLRSGLLVVEPEYPTPQCQPLVEHTHIQPLGTLETYLGGKSCVRLGHPLRINSADQTQVRLFHARLSRRREPRNYNFQGLNLVKGVFRTLILTPHQQASQHIPTQLNKVVLCFLNSLLHTIPFSFHWLAFNSI